MVAIDDHIAQHGDAAQIDGVGAPVAHQARGAGGRAGVDHLDAAGGTEAAQTDVHIGALGHDAVGAGSAAVGVGVEAGKAAPATGLVARDEVGVGTVAAVHRVVTALAEDQVVAIAAQHRIVAVAGIDQVVAGAGQNGVVVPLADDLVGTIGSAQQGRRVGADDQGGSLDEVVEPSRHVRQAGVGVAVFVEEASVPDFESEVVDAVGDGVHQVLAEVVGVGAIVLHQVVAGFGAVFVVAVQFDEAGQPCRIGAQPGIDCLQVAGGDPAVGHGTRCGDALQDQRVQGIGGVGAAVDVGRGRVAAQARVDLDGVDNAVQPGPGAGRIGQEVVQPAGHVVHRRIGVAILVAEAAVHDLETDVVEAVGHGVDQVLAKEGRRRTVVLDLVIAGLGNP